MRNASPWPARSTRSKARRDFLESDVEHLELFLVDQRTRIRDAATALLDVTERVPGGLGDVRPPLLSAAADDSGISTGTGTGTGGSGFLGAATTGDRGHTSAAAAVESTDGGAPSDAPPSATEPDSPGVTASDDDADSGQQDPIDDPVDDLVIQTDIADDVDLDGQPDADADVLWGDEGDEGNDRDAPTQAMPVVDAARNADDSGGFRFSFDDDR